MIKQQAHLKNKRQKKHEVCINKNYLLILLADNHQWMSLEEAINWPEKETQSPSSARLTKPHTNN